MTAPPVMQTISWTRLLEFIGSKGWTVELSEHCFLKCAKDDSVVFGPGPAASHAAWIQLIDRLGYIDGIMATCRKRRP